jgi:ABC-2 type transport system permease protein
MRMFAEEKKNGTIELLLTKPLSEYKIILAKLFAGITLVFISILPTVVYYVSVYLLGDPVGNIDTGGVVGSYIGLLFLGSAFVAIGLFSSVLTTNQIVAFIIAVLLSVFCYLGFETLYNMDIFGSLNLFVRSLGMRYHYESISRGVIDTRDVIYFLSVIALFVMLTRLVLQSAKWQK